ncbi:MAG: FAD-dependent oxidoreductase [Patescibacteria group bacterium]
MEQVQLLILGSGTAASNAARSAKRAGLEKVLMVHLPELINTCVEEGCMPSKSILAGAHQHESFTKVSETRNQHIDRLRDGLVSGFAESNLEYIVGQARFSSDTTVAISTESSERIIEPTKIIIATGSTPFVPPIEGLSAVSEHTLLSHDVVSKKATIDKAPERLLVVGGGPIGLELSSFFHDMGSQVTVLERGSLLPIFDPEFSEERLRASQDKNSFPIILGESLTKVSPHENGVLCTISSEAGEREAVFDKILIATGRKPNTDELGLENTSLERDERGGIVHNQELQTSLPHIFIAGDVTGHHKVLHYAAKMGELAGYNAAQRTDLKSFDYDRHALFAAFDQFSSAVIGLTETEAKKRDIEVMTATRHFNSIGLGILKRQEYGLWKLVVEAESGLILGSQIVGPDSAGELIQLFVPLLANHNTVNDIMAMTWYHPTYAEIVYSLAKDICAQQGIDCPGM